MNTLTQEITRLASEYAEHKHLDKEAFAVAVEKLLRQRVEELRRSPVDFSEKDMVMHYRVGGWNDAIDELMKWL